MSHGEADRLETAFLEFCRKNPAGATDRVFRAANPSVLPQDLVLAINGLVSKGKLELFRGSDGLVYKMAAEEESQVYVFRVQALEGDEKIVYQCIKAADNRGVWTRDLKTRTNLHQTVITKVLRTLESRKIIKAVKSVKNSTRKVYMLAHLEPSIDITGGPWFSENELDTEFIEEMCKICYRYVLSRTMSSRPDHILAPDHGGYPDVESVWKFVQESRVTTAELTVEDISMLLDRLIFDGLIERVVSLAPRASRIVGDDEDDDIYVLKAVRPDNSISALGSIPCGVCPVFDQCSEQGPITPAKCEYYNDWLRF